MKNKKELIASLKQKQPNKPKQQRSVDVLVTFKSRPEFIDIMKHVIAKQLSRPAKNQARFWMIFMKKQKERKVCAIGKISQLSRFESPYKQQKQKKWDKRNKPMSSWTSQRQDIETIHDSKIVMREFFIFY